MMCLACDSQTRVEPGAFADFIRLRTGATDTVTRVCPACGLRFSGTRLTPEQEAALYADYRGPSYNAQRDSVEPGYSTVYAHISEPRPYLHRIEALISEYLTPTRVLDIGGHDGRNTPFADRAVTYEIGDPAPEGRFDLVVMAHVLEHVAYPRHLINYARSHLALNGVLYVEVPVENPGNIWHEHQTQWTEAALRSCLDVLHLETLAATTGPVFMVVAR